MGVGPPVCGVLCIEFEVGWWGAEPGAGRGRLPEMRRWVMRSDRPGRRRVEICALRDGGAARPRSTQMPSRGEL